MATVKMGIYNFTNRNYFEIIILDLGFHYLPKFSYWRLWTTKGWIWVWWYDDNRGTYTFFV